MILCADFDWTIFFPDNPELTNNNLLALQKWRQQGNLVSIVTNRNLLSLECGLPDYEKYADYIVTNMGAEIYQAKNKLLKAQTLAEDDAEQLLAAIQQLSPAPGIIYYNVAEKVSLSRLSNLTKIRLWFPDETTAGQALSQLPAIGYHSAPIYYAPASAQNDDPIDQKMSQKYHYFVDYSATGASKESGIRYLAKTLGIPLGQIITAGDDILDLGMLQGFNGYAIADSVVAHLHPELKTTPSVAKLITDLASDT